FDLNLVATLLRLSRGARAVSLEALDPERPLLRWRLIDVAADRSIRATSDLVATLCGRQALPPELARYGTLVSAPATLDDLCLDDSTRIAAQTMCDAAARDPRGDAPWLVLWGPAGIGKKTIAARIAAHGGRVLVTCDPTAFDRVAVADALARAQREAMLRDAMLYLGPMPEELHTDPRLATMLADFRGPLAIGVDTTQPPRLSTQRPVWELGLRLPSEPTRIALWTAQLPTDTEVDIPSLARAFNLTAGEIVASAREATAIAAREHVPVRHASARACVARRLRSDLGELARHVEVTTTWNDLVLPDQDMERVHEFIARKQFANQVYADWGYGARVGGGKGLIALFSGPPGTGKTMLAGIIARALDLDLYQIDLGSIVSKWVGETEKQLGKVFDQAERAHAVLLFDEADSLFAKRTEVQSSADRYGNMAVNYLLQRLEQYTGIAVLTTNKDTSLDEALQRRLTLRLFLDVPEVEERTRLWRSFVPPRAPVALDVDYSELAREFELSGGYIKNAAVRAAFLAASSGRIITMDLLRHASALELEDMGRVVWHRRLAA
ncbi:MAG TPA: AAA family ATPase, partial [Kofleriaceae bacterium]